MLSGFTIVLTASCALSLACESHLRPHAASEAVVRYEERLVVAQLRRVLAAAARS